MQLHTFQDQLWVFQRLLALQHLSILLNPFGLVGQVVLKLHSLKQQLSQFHCGLALHLFDLGRKMKTRTADGK